MLMEAKLENIKLVELEKIFDKDLDLMLFYVSWLKNGLKASNAYRELHPEVTSGSAEVLGSRMLRKVKDKIGVEAVMSIYGIDIDLYMKQLREGSLAQKRDQFSGEMYPDHKTRKDYNDKIGKLLGLEKGGESLPQNTQNNYFNLTDEQLDKLIESKRRETGTLEIVSGETEENIIESSEVRQESQ